MVRLVCDDARVKFEPGRLTKVMVPERPGRFDGACEGMWAYVLADAEDVPGALGSVGMLLCRPVTFDWVLPGDLLLMASSQWSALYGLRAERIPDAAPAEPPSASAWTDADLRAWWRASGTRARAVAAAILAGSQDEVGRILRDSWALPSLPRCQKCGGRWSPWMVRWRHWALVGAEWTGKHLCWPCYEGLAGRGAPKRPLTDGELRILASRGELDDPRGRKVRARRD